MDTHEIVRLDVDRDILGPISHRPVLGLAPPLGWMSVVGSIDPQSGGVVAFGGDIDTVQTVTGGLTCDLLAIDGAIGSVQIGGIVGSSDEPVEIAAGNGDIGSVTAHTIYASIVATQGSNGPGYLQKLDAEHGQFVGAIEARALQDTSMDASLFGCKGDMDANITATNGNLADPLIIDGGDFPAGRTLSVTSLSLNNGRIEIREVSGTSIGGHLYGDMLFGGGINEPERDIFIDNGLCGLFRIGYHLAGDIRIYGTPGQTDEGLTGQVIVNGLNWPEDEPHGWDDWTGSVSIGPDPSPIVLGPVPYYDSKSSTFGGGAVGKVPYYLHYQDCTPSGTKVNENMSTGLDGWADCNGWHVDKVLGPGGSLTSVTLHHYGPILREGSGMPVTVWRKSLAELNCSWDDETENFTHTMHPGGTLREVRVDGAFADGFLYRIEPNNDSEDSYLYCGGLDASVGKVSLRHDDNDPDLDYGYEFVLRVRRIQDITLNGLLQPDDITAWLAEPEDTTLDGITDSADLVDVTEAVAESGDW
ncbi:MAG: hypothetical protein IT431_09080 [Phycisphaerales bacterium]|nr:hypothetical protein [Phycisphaerales bacterium]